MMRPHFLRCIAGNTCFVQTNMLRRLTRIISSHISARISTNRLVVSIPALLHRMSLSPSAEARPIPLAPPVTNATLPLSLPMMRFLLFYCWFGNSSHTQELCRFPLEAGEIVSRLVQGRHFVVMKTADDVM